MVLRRRKSRNCHGYLLIALSADLTGTLNVEANVAGSIDTGSIPLLSLGLPGLDIEGILSIGPTLNLNAEAKATVDVDVDLNVDLAYSINNLNFVFPPPPQGGSSIDVAPNDSPLRLSVSPDVAANASIEAHLIPSLNFGLTALKVFDASIFLDLDASATLDLGLDAGATGSIDSNGDKSVSADATGCVDIEGALSVNVGAKGKFFKIFSEQTQIPLFSKEFELFQKCFADSTSTPSDTSAPAANTVPASQTSQSVVPSASGPLSSDSATSTVQGSSSPSVTPTSTQTSSSVETSASAQKRGTRNLHSRAALTCTPPGVGPAQLLVDEQ